MAPTGPLQPQGQLPNVCHNEVLHEPHQPHHPHHHEPQVEPQHQQPKGQSKVVGLHDAENSTTSPELHLAYQDLPPNAQLIANFLFHFNAHSSLEESKVFTLHPAEFNILEANDFCQQLLNTKAHSYDYIPLLYRFTLIMTPPRPVHDKAVHNLMQLIHSASTNALQQSTFPASLANARLELGFGTSEILVKQDGIRTKSYKLPDGEIVFDKPGEVIPAF
ncbi:hypothetical protein PG994_015366 [Apiospora phragmitis]|uniref:Uncharacterized protein n=1 Tax=Apiospora phragmitis TaxID=2905665 RepID=A0ABR1SRB4_9PEZI